MYDYLNYLKQIKCASQKTLDWLGEYKNKTLIMLSTRDPPQTQGYWQTESKGIQEGIPCKWKSEERWSSNTHIRQNRL